jgi:phospholipid transport system substrate-binding protein
MEPMPNRRTLLSLAALALGGGVLPLAGRASATPGAASAAFVKTTGDQLVAIISGAGDQHQKRAELERVIDASVDIDGIGRFCLGRFWQRATADQQHQYIQVFRAMLVTNVAQKLGEYRGVQFSVGRTQPRDGGDLVATTIERPNNQPSHVDWLIVPASGSPRIEDMISEGVSMRITQRNDYESFLNGNGGDIAALIRGLQQKAAQLAAAN